MNKSFERHRDSFNGEIQDLKATISTSHAMKHWRLYSSS